MQLAELARLLGETLVGDGAIEIHQVASLEEAQTGHLSFLTNSKYRKQLDKTQASAVILHPDLQEITHLPRILAHNPYACYAKATALLNPRKRFEPGIHPTAVVAQGVRIDPSASIGPLVTLAAGVEVGVNAVIMAGCHLGENVKIGDDSLLYPNVTVYHGCQIGKRAIIHAGAVIGADGFGFANEHGKWLKIPQIGRVVVGDDVEVGANTTIDRGALNDTVIADGVKLDNQIQIAHNVRVGENVAMAGCAGVAGSAVIGAGSTVGGGGMVLGHLTLAEGVHVTAGTLVTKSITEPGKYSSAMPVMEHRAWLRTAANMKHIDELAARISELEKSLESLKGNKT